MTLPAAPSGETKTEIEEITVAQFYEKISQENDLLLLDVRSQDDYESWRIESRYTTISSHMS